MEGYESIDPILSKWAQANDLTWFTTYQDAEVRTFYLDFDRRDRVQVAVDVPKQESTMVWVGQNRRGLSRLHRAESIPTSTMRLGAALDRALQLARSWLADEDELNGVART